VPVKMARSAPRASFGLPELLLVVSTPRLSLAARPERREHSHQFGGHPGNPVIHVSDARLASHLFTFAVGFTERGSQR
jgi:hypothetical protein